MSDATLEKIIAEIQALSPEQQEELRRLLNGTPILLGLLPELPITPRILSTNGPIKDRVRENEWLQRHRDEYAGQWVALDGDRLLAYGPHLKEVAEAAERAGAPDALMVRVEPSNALPWAGF
jgi:hypothetical protein